MAQAEFLFSDRPDPADPVAAQPDDLPAPTDARPTPGAVAPVAPRLPAIFTVTQLTRLIKLTLTGHLPARIVVQGEISNYSCPASGHLYLTLKDEHAQVPAVMWRSAAKRLKFRPADGLAVVATGRVDVFEPQGKYQFYLDKLEPAGLGALELAFRQLAEKLRREGLFEEKHKKPLPAFPRVIAIVTSGTGAAIKDITQTLHRRFPIVRKLLYPVAVQGQAAAREIAHAIEELNRRTSEFGGIDLIIVGRGGGSLEDLWAFNEEIVARAVFASRIPIITGIGHEIDTTIADLVADQRAATPTAAAERAVPVLDELSAALLQTELRIIRALRQRLALAGRELKGLASRPLFARPLDRVRLSQQTIDERIAVLNQCLAEYLRRATRRLEEDTAVLRRIEPHAALAVARARLAEQHHLLNATLRSFWQQCRYRLDRLVLRLDAATPVRRVREQHTTLDHWSRRIRQAQRQVTRQQQQRLEGVQRRLENLDPRAVLARGYSITRHKRDGRIITHRTPPHPGDLVVTELAERITIESKVTRAPAERPAT